VTLTRILELRKEMSSTPHKEKSDGFWFPIVAEEFLENAKRKREKLNISSASEVMLRKSSALVSSFVMTNFLRF